MSRSTISDEYEIYAPVSVQIAMTEETLSDITSVYKFWNRSMSLMKYQMSRIALNGEWDTLLFLIDRIPFDKDTTEYRSTVSYAYSIMIAYNVDSLLPPGTVGNMTDAVVTLDMIHTMQRRLTLNGSSIPVNDDETDPLIVEHTYPWWDVHNEETLYEIVYNPDLNPVHRMAISYGANIPITEDTIQ